MRILRLWHLSRRMQSTKWEERAEAARILGERGDPRAIKMLMPALIDENLDVRVAVGRALARLGKPAADPLVELLQGEDLELRKAAAGILAHMGGEAVDPLIGVLNHKDPVIRSLVADLLAEIGDVRTVQPLAAMLNDWHPSVRTAVIHALGRLWGPAVEPLTDLLKDWNHEVRAAAAEVLGQSHDLRAIRPLLGALQDKETDVQQAAIDALAKIGGSQTALHMVHFLTDGRSSTQDAAMQVLLKLGTTAIEPLAEAVRDADASLRATAAGILGEIATRYGEAARKPVIDLLAAALRDQDTAVRRTAATTLTKIGWRPPDGNQRARLAVAGQDWTAAAAEGEDAVEALTAVLSSLHRSVRLGAAQALGEIRSPRAVDALIRLLDDDFPDVVNAVITALGRIGDPRAVEPLSNVLQDERRRIAAAEALGEIGDPRALRPLAAVLRERDEVLQEKASEALLRIGTGSLGGVIAALTDSDRGMRRLAADLLGRIGDAQAVKHLQAATNDPDAAVCEAAAEALRRIQIKGEQQQQQQ